ncbi:helix-turn-helix transcriptional regulator [Nonomuraea sp. bgisy101]|uniref:helix-turn-helix transcriptional regulator n=1 Tax=Nonomuraea sp. bgisy101 TaxID=3413784 RepID=UPI003D70990C
MADPRDLAVILRAERIQQGRAQKYISRRLGIGQAAMCTLERGHGLPTPSRLLVWANVLGQQVIVRKGWEWTAPVHSITDLIALLRDQRLTNGWNYTEAGERAGVHPRQISHWEAGRMTPSLPGLARWLTAYGWRLDIRAAAPTTPRSTP